MLDCVTVKQILAVEFPTAARMGAVVDLGLVVQLMSPQVFGARVDFVAYVTPVCWQAFASFGDSTGFGESYSVSPGVKLVLGRIGTTGHREGRHFEGVMF